MLYRFLCFLVWGLLGLGTQASAKGGDKVTPPAGLRGGQYFIELPVSWEILRSGFNTLDAALEAETFVETLGFYYIDSYESYLITPRGRARVVTLAVQDPSTDTFDTLGLDESEFARILGIDHSPWHSSPSMVFIKTAAHESDSQTIVLTASPKYFISITLSLN